jgi:endonuclease/exonuclease/phosphatase family metal-dependent hydrolase
MRKINQSILLGLFFLFLLQLLSDFIESIYAFGLLVTRFTIEIASVALLFAPILLLFFRRGLKRPALLALAYVALACRLVAPFLPLNGKLVVSGLGLAALLVLLPAWLAGRAALRGKSLGQGLALAIVLSIFLRALGSGSDVSLTNPLLAILTVGLAGWLLYSTDLPGGDSSATVSNSFSRLTGLSLGLAAVFVIIYFAFASPTVIARWTGFSYPVIVTVLVAALVLFAVLMASSRFVSLLTPRFVLAWNALFVLSMVLTILPHQIVFPAVQSAYPLDALPASALAALPLLIMLALSPIIIVDFILFARAIAAGRPSAPQIGGAFTIAALFLLVMVLFHIFTSVYDYAPGIGPLFRDRFWFVYLLAGLGLSLPILLVRREQFDFQPADNQRPYIIVISALALGAIFAVAFRTLRPLPQNTGSLNVMTYNIQQGFDANGGKGLDEQLAVIRRINPDLLGLEESDTARIANGNVDAVRYFADQLHMYSYYGPTTTTGTFGIALLSKYPIQNPGTFFMASTGEQTATIHAQVTVSGKSYNIFVTHLGNDGPPIQLQNVLTRIQGLDNVITMGDFNFPPTTDQYALMTKTLSDSWLVKNPNGKVISGADTQSRIDFIFISPGLPVLNSDYIPGPASDHPALYTTIQP